MAYGGVCVCCGESEPNFLTFDHIYNDGASQRRRGKFRNGIGSIARYLKREGYPEGFQILCYNCNCAKGFYGMCPHQKEKLCLVA